MNRKIKIKQFTALWLIGYCFFFRPADYVIGNLAVKLINILTVGIALILVATAVYFQNYGYRLKGSIKAVVLFYFWCLVGSSTINYLNGNSIDFGNVFVFFSTAVAFILLSDIGLWLSPRKTLKCFLTIGITMCSINAITIFIYHNSGGMNHGVLVEYGRQLSKNYYFFGEDNATYFWCWPVLVIGWFYYFKYNSEKSYLAIISIFTLLLTASYIYVWSALAMVACAVVPVTMFLFIRGLNKEKKGMKVKQHKGLQFWYMWIIGLAFNALLSLQVILAWFQPVVQQIFNKDATLSSRVYIWERSYLAIANSPLIGYGCEPAEVSSYKILINHTHNMFVETLYRGGAIGLLLLIIMFALLTYESRAGKESVLYKYLIVTIFCFIVYSSMYFAFYRYHYILLLILMVHTELFNDANIRNKRKRT